jgi:hypothetical protein
VVDFERFFIVVMVCINVCMREDNFVCSGCGKAGYRRPTLLNKYKNHFCNNECRKKTKIPNFNCSNCDKAGFKFASRLKKSRYHFCSVDCKKKFKDFQSEEFEVNCSYCKIKIIRKPYAMENHKNHFCSSKCSENFRIKKIPVECSICGVVIYKTPSHIKSRPRHCCSRECFNILNRTKKDWGSKRSKLEIAIEKHLNLRYQFEIRFNRADIGYELDIYIPVLDLAIEINGIFHYKPYWGENRLIRTQELDREKMSECDIRGIKLVVVDVSMDGSGKQVLIDRINEVENIVRDRIEELGYVFKNEQMVLSF